MGLNLVIGCHQCRERVWFYRCQETPGLFDFYRAHWQHAERVRLSDDQSDFGWVDDYPDVGERYGIDHEWPLRKGLMRFARG